MLQMITKQIELNDVVLYASWMVRRSRFANITQFNSLPLILSFFS